MARRAQTLLLLALALPHAGCCGVARWLCGPDASDWVSVSFLTSDEAVRTVLEAIRRDQPDVVSLSLSQDFKARNRLDGMTARLAFQQLKEQNPGLHVAGYATVPAAVDLGPARRGYRLEVHGYELELEVVRAAYWSVTYERERGRGEAGAYLGSLQETVTIEAAEDGTGQVLRLVPLTFPLVGFEAIRPEQVIRAEAGHEWKVDRLAIRELP